MSTTNISQVKVAGSVIKISYESASEAFTLASTDRPRPELLVAFQAVGDIISDHLGMASLDDDLALSAIDLGPDSVRATFTASFEHITKHGKVTTPAIGIGDDAKAEFGKRTLEKHDAGMIDQLRTEALRYVRGDRAQAALKLDGEEEAA